MIANMQSCLPLHSPSQLAITEEASGVPENQRTVNLVLRYPELPLQSEARG